MITGKEEELPSELLPKDVEKAALRNPDFNFVIYHSAYRHAGGPGQLAPDGIFNLINTSPITASPPFVSPYSVQ